MKPIELKSFPVNKELCPVSQIRHYLNMTAGICGVFIKVFISYTPRICQLLQVLFLGGVD